MEMRLFTVVFEEGLFHLLMRTQRGLSSSLDIGEVCPGISELSSVVSALIHQFINSPLMLSIYRTIALISITR